GCTPAYISRIEKGERMPSLQLLRALAERLGVTEEFLAYGRGEAKASPPPIVEARVARAVGGGAGPRVRGARRGGAHRGRRRRRAVGARARAGSRSGTRSARLRLLRGARTHVCAAVRVRVGGGGV